MSEYRVVRDYPHPPTTVWRALTDPAIIPRWTSTGLGGRPEGFSPVVGNRFKFIAKPAPGFRGFVECEVLEVRAPELLRYTWVGDENGETTYVTYRVEPHEGGTRLTIEHTGFTGTGGFIVSRILRRVRRKMLDVGLPAVLAELDDSAARQP